MPVYTCSFKTYTVSVSAHTHTNQTTLALFFVHQIWASSPVFFCPQLNYSLVDSFHKSFRKLVKNGINYLQFVLCCIYMILPCFSIIQSYESVDWFEPVHWHCCCKRRLCKEFITYLSTSFYLNVVFCTISVSLVLESLYMDTVVWCNVLPVYSLFSTRATENSFHILRWYSTDFFHHVLTDHFWNWLFA
jgi:hypothetical protein